MAKGKAIKVVLLGPSVTTYCYVTDGSPYQAAKSLYERAVMRLRPGIDLNHRRENTDRMLDGFCHDQTNERPPQRGIYCSVFLNLGQDSRLPFGAAAYKFGNAAGIFSVPSIRLDLVADGVIVK